jgi:hypothetical protein
MFLFSSNGPRSVSDERIVFVTREHAPGRYQPCVLVLDDGREICGLALKEALDALERKLATAA